MLNNISAELMKCKRGKMLLFFLVAVILYIACIFVALPSPGQISTISYLWLFYDSFSFIFLIHIMVLGLLSATMFSNEYRNNTIRQLITTPVSAAQFLFSKQAVIMMFSVLLMLSYSISVTLIATITQSMELTAFNISMIFIISIVDAVTICMALAPIFLIMVVSKQNYLFPVLAVFIYTVISLLPSMGMITISNKIMSYAFPLGSVAVVHNTLVYGAFSSELSVTMPSESWIMCLICLCLYVILCSVLSVAVIKKQEH